MIDSTPKPVPIQMVILREYGITLVKYPFAGLLQGAIPVGLFQTSVQFNHTERPVAKYNITLLKMQDHVVFACLSCGHAKVLYRQNWDTVVPPMGECKCEVKTA